METTRSLQPNSSLESIINPPLKTSQSTNHDNSGSQSSPKSIKSNVFVNGFHIIHSGSFSFHVVQFRDHGVSWMRNDGTDDTGEVSWSESDTKLSEFRVFIFGFSGKNVIVKHFNCFLEKDEFDDGVGNLSGPKRS